MVGFFQIVEDFNPCKKNAIIFLDMNAQVKELETK